MRLKAQILKDYGLSTQLSATFRKKKTENKSDSDYQQQLKDIWHRPVETEISGVYEGSINHGYDCQCCTPILKESVMCPTREEKSLPRSRGRPRLRR